MMARSPHEQMATDALVAEGRAALVAGEKSRAQALLQAAVRKEPDHVEAWLWLSGTHSAPEDMAYCLRKVLLLDPGNEQAREGLSWLAQTHGVAVPATLKMSSVAPQNAMRLPTPLSNPHTAPPARTIDERQAERRHVAAHAQQVARAAQEANAQSTTRAWEMASYVAGVGAVIGVLRLIGALRPATLLLVRRERGPLDMLDAVTLALGTAAVHGLVVLVAWLVFAAMLASARNDQHAGIADTLYRAGSVLMPAYWLLGGVAIAAVAVGWSEGRWLPAAGAICAIMLVSAALIWRRIMRLFDLVRVSQRRRTLRVIGIVGPALAIAVGGFVAAGLAMRALLSAL
jgi:hypothetical protein